MSAVICTLSSEADPDDVWEDSGGWIDNMRRFLPRVLVATVLLGTASARAEWKYTAGPGGYQVQEERAKAKWWCRGDRCTSRLPLWGGDICEHLKTDISLPCQPQAKAAILLAFNRMQEDWVFTVYSATKDCLDELRLWKRDPDHTKARCAVMTPKQFSTWIAVPK